MPRSCTANSSEKLFDADEHISNLQKDIAEILFVTGLDPNNFDNYEIDEIITAIMQTFSTKSATFGRDPAYPFVYGKYKILMHRLRNDFLHLQISKYGKQL